MTAAAVVLLIAAYWTPTLIARFRSHRQVGPIFVVNLLLGWTAIGWIVALAMSVSGQDVAPRGVKP